MSKKILKKRISLVILSLLFVFSVCFWGNGILNYLEFINAVEANSPVPDINAGKITLYQLGCATVNGKCTCGVCDGFCDKHNMIIYTPQIAKSPTDGSLCVPSEFKYKGGGIIPKPGDDLIYGGIAPRGNLIKVIGIPGASASSVKGVVDSFKGVYDFIIAGFKES